MPDSNQLTMKNTCTLFIHALLLACLLLSACSRESAMSEPPPPEVTVATPLVKEVTDWDKFTGRLVPVETVEIRARVSGYLEAVKYREGAMVEKGDLLYIIDPRPYQATLDAATAQVAMAEAALRLADNELRRAQRLIKSKTIAEEELDVKTQERASAVAALDLARATERAARLDLEFTRIQAPISGRIGRSLVTPGNLISNGGDAGSTLLTTIVSMDPIHFYLSTDERDYLKYLRLDRAGERPSSRTANNPVRLRLPDETEFVHEGVMDFIDNRIDDATGTMTGRAIFDNPDFLLVPGLFAEIQLIGAGPYDSLQVPDAAIASDQSQKFVFVIDDNNLAHRRLVTPGRLDGSYRIIREGLEATDRLVINGIQRVRAGMPVQPETVQLTAD